MKNPAENWNLARCLMTIPCLALLGVRIFKELLSTNTIKLQAAGPGC